MHFAGNPGAQLKGPGAKKPAPSLFSSARAGLTVICYQMRQEQPASQ